MLQWGCRRVTFSLADCHFDAAGLVPVIAQDHASGRVLMFAYANQQALEHTLATGEMHFYSRSRQELWHKGSTSGQILRVKSLLLDCDGDAVLALVDAPEGACHTGRESCFDVKEPAAGELGRLYATLTARTDPRTSYTARLRAAGTDRMLRKLGEEATEVILAAKNHAQPELIAEVCDLLYHLLVVLVDEGVPLDAIAGELERRSMR